MPSVLLIYTYIYLSTDWEWSSICYCCFCCCFECLCVSNLIFQRTKTIIMDHCFGLSLRWRLLFPHGFVFVAIGVVCTKFYCCALFTFGFFFFFGFSIRFQIRAHNSHLYKITNKEFCMVHMCVCEFWFFAWYVNHMSLIKLNWNKNKTTSPA